MPQMMPLPWLSLFFSFLLILFVSASINYFFFIPSIKKTELTLNSVKLNWKW